MLATNDVAKCERWFDDNGLPYFVESGHEAIQRALTPRAVGFWALAIAVAVIDENYRRESFTRIEDDLQRATGVRKVCFALRAHLAGRPGTA